jgi:hypothetical protein
MKGATSRQVLTAEYSQLGLAGVRERERTSQSDGTGDMYIPVAAG